MKKILINNRKIPAKYVYKIFCRQGKAAYVKHKEAVVFDYGVILIKNKAGKIYQISTEEEVSTAEEAAIRSDFYVYIKENEENEIFCTNARVEAFWQQICIYFFDDEGAFYLFADRDCMPSFGVAYESVTEYKKDDCRTKAVNAMALIEKESYQKILDMEDRAYIEEKQLSLLVPDKQ